MGRTATRLLVTALLLALGALLSIAVAAGSPTANSTMFNDASGDNNNGPDITGVRVTNRDDGQLVFEISVPNRQGLIGSEVIFVYMDTDRSGNTGANGFDFVFSYFGRSGRVWIDKWTGSSYTRQRQSLDSGWGFSPRTLTLRDRLSEFSLSGHFEFMVQSYSTYEPPTTSVADRTPRWRHNLTAGPTPAPTTTRATVAAADADADGVSDPADKCVNQKRGPYDRNHNGCPGPFSRISLRLSAPYETSEDYTWWSSKRPPVLFMNLPAPDRARVVIDDAIHTEKGVTELARYKSRMLLTTKYALGRVITFKVTKPGWIGAHWEVKILNRSPGYETHRILCFPPNGGSSKDCRQVSRGS